MARINFDGRLSVNVLLSQLPHDERGRLLARGRVAPIKRHEVLYDVGAPIEAVYFPSSGLFSVLARMSDGSAMEVGSIGRDGMLGLTAAIGAQSSDRRCFCQVPGEALCIDVDLFLAELERPALRQLVMRYLQTYLTQVTQLAACNGLHSIQQRCARWILMAQDQVGLDQVDLTQEFLAQMLGVRRASVNAAAATLQELGHIRYSRGRIKVINRAGVERTACECHRIISAGAGWQPLAAVS